jgi:micrococcal nuclease
MKPARLAYGKLKIPFASITVFWYNLTMHAAIHYVHHPEERLNRLIPVFILCLFPMLNCAGRENGAELKVYVTNSGKKYHLEDCSSLRKSKIAISLVDAAKSGYGPCSICKPPSVSLDSVEYEDAASGPLYRVNTAQLVSSSGADLSRMLGAEVVAHVDGDTVRVRISNPPETLSAVETVRMLGVDTPETVHPSRPVEMFGKEAGDFTKARLLGKNVLLAFDWDLRDRYGRILCYIYTEDGVCHNAALIREGYAHAYTRFTFQFMEEFRELEREAREQKRGLWADN